MAKKDGGHGRGLGTARSNGGPLACPRAAEIALCGLRRIGPSGRSSKPLENMVGAGRFERPTPCAQGSEIGSRGSVGYREFLMVTTIRGICFRSKSMFIGWNVSGSDTVLAQ